MAHYDKWNCLDRARDLLSTANDGFLRYACLELRFCIEAIVYEKLEAYSNYVPAAVLEKWQPNHAMKMLLQFEPMADEDFTLYVSPESEPGIPTGNWTCLGQHNTLKLSWLNKNYNKFGSYLHVKMGNKKVRETPEELSTIRKDIEIMLLEIERVVNSTIVGSTLASRIHFKCQVCEQPSLVNVDVLRKTSRAMCISPQCGAEYVACEDEVGWGFKLAMTSFKCLKCEKTNSLENQHVALGIKFRCKHCGAVHRIAGGQWSYERVTEEKTG
jgi:DNA-directed RNA polymerase subunit RPC12/RpoP